MLHADRLLTDIRALARRFAAERADRQQRRNLDPEDFAALRDIGFHLAGVPEAYGGWWQGRRQSLRPLCDAIRLLAQGDPSVALTASMHPGVLSFWTDGEEPASGLDGWEAQRRLVFQSVVGGAWWGTITSEPGSGGDIALTRAMAEPHGESHLISGEKHFGSGSGLTTHMLTTARRPGSEGPDWFVLDVGGGPWDGSTGMTLRAAWDGHGMTATNSHAFSFNRFPATRVAWSGTWRELIDRTALTPAICYTAVFPGIIDAAMRFTRQDFARRGKQPADFSAFEKVEWAAAHRQAALIYQSFEAVMAAAERTGTARHQGALAKANIAVLAESVMTRLCRLSGGGAYSRRSPLGFWFEDVRAAGFLRPPWSITNDAMFALSWQGEPGAMTIEEG